ncbi:MAG: hypothetical protein POG74_01385 [Acidocella sp.]|nr:hypothetical protein [Acidocella sp.]
MYKALRAAGVSRVSDAMEVISGLVTMLLGFLAATVGTVNTAVSDILNSAGIQPNLQILLLCIVTLVLIYFVFRWIGIVFAMLVLVMFMLLMAQAVVPDVFGVH